MKPVDTIPQFGVYSHCFGEDFNKMPKEANAILLSKRKITQEKIEIYAGQYCHIKELVNSSQ